MQSRLLVVDDDRDMREALGGLFSGDGHACEVAPDAAAALELVDARTFDVVICDVIMDGMGGLELLDRLRRTHPALPFIVITGKGDVGQAVDAIKRGAFEYVTKPCHVDRLRRAVAAALEGRRRPSESLRVAPPPANVGHLKLVGSGPAMRALQTTIDFLARSSAPVLVSGETGVGKELVARAIHALSPRSAGPFVAANSASFTAELSALELFGNPRSYPNPGTPERVGYFGEARGGTLFLDEIGEVLAAVQAPLLRALDGAYNRVGDPVSRPTACVVIVATNRDPASVKHDVLHRLGVTVETPALADRREDIPLLVRALLRGKTGGRDVEVDASLIVGLLRSPLPGNVRGVDNILTMALAAASGGQSPLRWPSRLSLPPPAPLAPPTPPPAPPAEPSGPDVATLLDGIRATPVPGKERLHQLLVDNHWNYTRVAGLLGMTVHQLYRLRMKYELHAPE
jgi:DNA-binding NtrC family response regulator